MKTIPTLIFALGFFFPSFAQTKNISLKTISNLWLKELFCFDSSGVKKRSCDLGLTGFQVNFSRVKINSKTGELTLEGRLSPAMPEVGLYLSDSDKIQTNLPVTFTSYDTADIQKDGYFSISYILKPKEALYFYHPACFVRQYDTYKLIKNNQPTRKRRR